MNAFAQAILDASFETVMTDLVRVTPADSSAVFTCRAYLLDPDEELSLGGLNASPRMGIQTLEVRKSEWPEPADQDRVEVLAEDGATVTRILYVVGAPISTDGKRLTWSIDCSEEDS